MLKKIKKVLQRQAVVLILMSLFSSKILSAVELQNVQISSRPNGALVEFTLSKKIEYRSFSLSNPDRIVIDLADVISKSKLTNLSFKSTPIQAMRSAYKKPNVLRLVFDLKFPVTLKPLTKPSWGSGYKLSFELYPSQLNSRQRAVPAISSQYRLGEIHLPRPPVNPPHIDESQPLKKESPRKLDEERLVTEVEQDFIVSPKFGVSPRIKLENLVIAIDPGHGGKDPGALGSRGGREKEVVLNISKRLQKELNKTPGVRAVLTRSGDYYIGLRALIGNRIYGCDDCQLFCPWNKFAKLTKENDFKPRHGLETSQLIDLFNWTEEEFLHKTEGSAMRRIGYDLWLRNLAIALGNAPKSNEVIRTLQQKENDGSPLVREHIQWAIQRQEHQAGGQPVFKSSVDSEPVGVTVTQ